jgi:hypothetical protein
MCLEACSCICLQCRYLESKHSPSPKLSQLLSSHSLPHEGHRGVVGGMSQTVQGTDSASERPSRAVTTA